jgi:glycosyl transferase family 11
MVIAELAGGLGNQMFQYAYGRSIAIRNNIELYLDLRFLQNKNQPKGFTFRDYRLNIFNINARILNEDLFNEADKMSATIRSKLFRKLYPPWSNYIKEKTKSFCQNYTRINSHVYLRGYWQNPRYFMHIKGHLKNELGFPPLISPSAISLKSQIISGRPSVAVHVRRGDYVTNPASLVACSPDYYTRAFSFLESRLLNAQYYIFSDEPQWVKENLDYPENSVVVEHSAATTDYEDMYLMSQCHHHIIANSSFSWWGAWLSDFREQIVIAPKIWDGRRRSEDIVINSWLLL